MFKTKDRGRLLQIGAFALCVCLLASSLGRSQESAGKTPGKPQSEASHKTPLPAEITLLETKVRFEANGDSRKEVHAVVKINNEIGVSQFARLNFDFHRSFQSVEIPLVRITHGSGGTADILPSAISDEPNPTVVNFPAYRDVRVKSVRVLGLAPNDMLEYRVITTTSHAPLAPDFWFEHSFDHNGIVSHEVFELKVSSSRDPAMRIHPATPPDRTTQECEGDASYRVYKWDRIKSEAAAKRDLSNSESTEPDVVLSTQQWETLSIRLDERMSFRDQPMRNLGAYEENGGAPPKLLTPAPDVAEKARELTTGMQGNRAKLEALYDFVSQKIRTVDLPLGSTHFVTRPASEILASGYATQEDKFVLFADLAAAVRLGATGALTGTCDKKAPASPLNFKRLLIHVGDGDKNYVLDPSLEVAPFGVIPPNSGDCAFVLNRLFFAMDSTGHEWQKLDAPLPFAARQRVTIDAALSPAGTLSASTKYVMRGQNELLLRLAFHQSPREKWDGVAQLLALSDGFRGKVTKATASDPYETHDAFTVSYEITQPKFLDWSKKPVRIPALLPVLGLPDPPRKTAAGGAESPIELGTPLDVEISATLHLPDGTGAEVPAGTGIQRDFATYESHYSVSNGTVTAARHLNFILRELPGDRAAEYNAFLHAVQNDESQTFTLERADAPATTSRKP